MRKFLFEAVARITYAKMWVLQRLFGIPAGVLMWLGQTSSSLVAKVGFAIMKRIDPLQCKGAEAAAEADPGELEFQNMELGLLSSAYKIRDHAMAYGDWTDEHTEAIEAVGNALMDQVGWDPQHVHNHLKSVVESIDGLTYDVVDEDD